jgi:peptide/nickel transport system substrate-binding protein
MRRPGNFLGYCSQKASKLMAAANGELDPTKRAHDYQMADAVMAAGLPAVPLYQRPNPLIYKSDIVGMQNNPSLAGPVWNIQDWHWK